MEKQVVNKLKGFLKKNYDFTKDSEYIRAFEDLQAMFYRGSQKSIKGLFINAVKQFSN